MNHNNNISIKRWTSQDLFCGYFVMSADNGALANSSDIFNMPTP